VVTAAGTVADKVATVASKINEARLQQENAATPGSDAAAHAAVTVSQHADAAAAACVRVANAARKTAHFALKLLDEDAEDSAATTRGDDADSREEDARARAAAAVEAARRAMEELASVVRAASEAADASRDASGVAPPESLRWDWGKMIKTAANAIDSKCQKAEDEKRTATAKVDELARKTENGNIAAAAAALKMAVVARRVVSVATAVMSAASEAAFKASGSAKRAAQLGAGANANAIGALDRAKEEIRRAKKSAATAATAVKEMRTFTRDAERAVELACNPVVYADKTIDSTGNAAAIKNWEETAIAEWRHVEAVIAAADVAPWQATLAELPLVGTLFLSISAP